MAQKIHILAENLCNKIAAGEVVERPASVVKELLENSLDAGASDIRIEVERGGKRLIRISDDGEGMGREDAFLCLERHGTSKIACAEDLFNLRTLGFRGEALPSIAAVSRLTLRTRNAESAEAWEIGSEGGVVRRAEAVGASCGTMLEVRDLFFNLPARRKFLRTDETELGHISDVVSKLALANPQVQFRLLHNERSLLELYRHTTLEERVAALLGRPVLRELLPLEWQGEGGIGLQGLISQPAHNRPTGSNIYTFINGRYIRDRVVQHAVMDGYRHLIVKGRYPVVVLFLIIDPALVDVNVHPTKHEVRFRDQRLVHDCIAEAVRAVLRPSDWLPRSPAEQGVLPPAVVPASVSGAGFEPRLPHSDPGAVQGVQEALSRYAARPSAQPAQVWRRPVAESSQPTLLTASAAPGESGFFSGLTVLGQYRRSYILCQDGDDLILIDQHAAHERIGFERLRAEYQQGALARQTLLFPAVLEFDFREAALFQDHLADLERLGFEIEPFGGKAFLLKAIPHLLASSSAEQLVRDVVNEVATIGRSALAAEGIEAVLILMACHGVIRANQTLAPEQIRALLRDLDGVDFQAHCPHGRPVMKRLPLIEIERMFKRS
ncbi:MAG: DNA mismatch repair endonuclease MutL [Trichloromonadaceae bacterium]